MTRYNPVGRLDEIIIQLEQLHEDAQDIFDAHVDAVMARNPNAISFGVTKWNEIAIPAGSAINYMAALKMLREKYAGHRTREPEGTRRKLADILDRVFAFVDAPAFDGSIFEAWAGATRH